MLDITTSPLIALYFAVEKDDTKPGYIYIYKSTPSEEKFDTGHTVAIKSALNLMDQEVINDFLDVFEKISENKLKDLEHKTQDEILNEFNEDSKKAINKFMELLNQRAKVRERLKYPIRIFNDLNRAHIILPSQTTDRIRQQQGAFIFPSYVNTRFKKFEEIQTEINESIKELNATLMTKKKSRTEFSCIEIKGGDKKIIREELEQLGITSGLIYPDIEHQSKALLEE